MEETGYADDFCICFCIIEFGHMQKDIVEEDVAQSISVFMMML